MHCLIYWANMWLLQMYWLKSWLVWTSFIIFIKGQCHCQCQWCTVWCSDLTCDWFGPPTVTSSKVSVCANDALFDVLNCHMIGLGHLHYLHQRSVSVPLFDVVTWHVTGLGHLQWLHQRSVPVVHCLMFWHEVHVIGLGHLHCLHQRLVPVQWCSLMYWPDS